MKTVKILAACAAAFLVAACGPKTVIDGTLTGGAGSDVIVKLLDVNRYQVLDTVKTDAAGAFIYRPELQKGQPEFIYLFHGDRKVASLLLQAGDCVKVTADTLGNYTVEGSDESLLLQEVEGEYAQFLLDMNRLANQQSDQELSRRYVEHYRRCLRYVLEHTKSLTSVPVLFQRVNDNLAVFDQPTDGIVFRRVCDSLRTVYPESRYIRALESEANRREQALQMGQRLRDAEQIGFFDIDLPSVDGSRVKLSDVQDNKVVMLYFWATTAEQKMFNLDALVPIYNEFHGRGFEVYAVSLDPDKTVWASAVRNQQLPWINVCDTRGADSPYVSLYGLAGLPTAYFLVNGDLDGTAAVSDAASIRKYLQNKL